MSWLVPLAVLVPLIGAAATLGLRRSRAQVIVAILSLAVTLAVGVALLIAVDLEGTLVMSVGGWPVPIGIMLVVDRLSALLVVVSAVVLLGVFLFSVGQGFADGIEQTPVTIYYPAYLILAAGVMTAFVSGDLFNLYVGFEILLVASYVLITIGGTESRIRTGTTYIVVSLVSSALFLAAIAMLYGALGTVNLAQLAERIPDLPPAVQTVLQVLLLLGFAIKAAVFPLSFWLPDSYPTAPAPVTAVFAGLLTKVGVYAIIRTETLLFPGTVLEPILLAAGSATLIFGVLGAIAQSDLKRLLSFTLVSHIGYLLVGIGLGTLDALTATTYYMVHHIIVQTTLFLAAGLIERIAGSTALPRIGGLLKVAPFTAALFFISVINLGGIPPFSGFLGKVGILYAALEQGSALGFIAVIVGTLVSLLTLYALIRAWSSAFWRPRPADEDVAHDEPSKPAIATKRTIGIMTTSTAALVGVGVSLTIFAGPLYAYSERAAIDLTQSSYENAVFQSEEVR